MINMPVLKFKRVVRLTVNKLVQCSPAVILIVFATVTLIANVGYNIRDFKTFSFQGNRISHKKNPNSQIAQRHDLKQIQYLTKDSPIDKDTLARMKTLYPTDGYDRALFLQETCSKINSGRKNSVVRVSYDTKHAALFCPLCKLASTFWTRVFQMMARNGDHRLIKHPFEVPISEAPGSKQYFRTIDQLVNDKPRGKFMNAKDSFRFLFVRDPFSLLFSAFVDKIVGPNPTFWNTFKSFSKAGTDPCGSNLSFEQFLRNIVQRYKTKHTLDCHVATFDECHPCEMNYTFVAKMETFKQDTFHILARLNQTQTLQVFHEQFSSLHADDAIDDSTSGPFSWKAQITKCMSWNVALKRVWRKLQIRGIIGGRGFPLSDTEANTITKSQFIKLVRKTRSESSSEERGWLKKQAFKEAYKSVSSDVLDEIRKIYSNEFLLFDYSDLLKIFDDDSNFRNYNLLSYNNINEQITPE